MPHAASFCVTTPGSARGETPAAADEPPAATEVDVRLAPGVNHRIDRGWIADHVQQAAAMIAVAERITISTVSVFVVDDARMAELHDRHSGIATTTDVLTFDLRHDQSEPIQADLVVCADEAARRAAELGHGIDRELLLYCVHGLLHCAGHDDHDQVNWQRMHAREDEILRSVGVGAVFDARSRQPRNGGAAP